MKQQKIALSKKLFLNRSVIAALSSNDQAALAGGFVPVSGTANIQTVCFCPPSMNMSETISAQIPVRECLCCA
ncbi:class I lanthipeptide [Chitinophaga nivalis]